MISTLNSGGVPPRICMIIPQVFSRLGGTERQVLLLSKTLAARDIPVIIMTQRHDDLHRPEITGSYGLRNVIRTIPAGFLFGVSYLLSTFLNLLKYRDEYNIIHSHFLYLHTPAAVLAGKLLKKKVVVKIACGGDEGDIATMRKITGGSLLLRCSRLADAFIALNTGIRDELLAIGVPRERIHQFSNYVDTEAFAPARENRETLRSELGLNAAGTIVAFSGRLTEQKGVSYLLDAWRICRRRDNALLLILGDGPLRKDLERLAESAGILGSVRFLGARNDIARYLSVADMFVLPSLYEGMPNALLEAMSAGLACIGTGIDGIRELVEEGRDGLLVKPCDALTLSLAIDSLIADRDNRRRLGYNARTKIQKNYSTGQLVTAYKDLYQKLLGPSQ